MSTTEHLSGGQSESLQSANIRRSEEQYSRCAHAIENDVDLIDAALVAHEALTENAEVLEEILFAERDACRALDDICNVASELHGAAIAAIEAGAAESRALWNGPPVALVDGELHRRRLKLLPAWMPAGRFDEVGDFIAVIGDFRVTVSPADRWRAEAGGTARLGSGLSRLRALLLSEPYPDFLARAAGKLGIPAAEPRSETI